MKILRVNYVGALSNFSLESRTKNLLRTKVGWMVLYKVTHSIESVLFLNCQ